MPVDLVADARATFVDSPFSETIRYWPYQGTPRDIQVVVDRNPPEVDVFSGGEVGTRRFVISAIRSTTDGIDHPNLGQDTVEIKIHEVDLLPVPFRLTRDLAPNDRGMMRLEVVQ